MQNAKWLNKKAGSPAFLARLKNILTNLIFPIECVSCGKPGNWLCEWCLDSLVNPNYFYCPSCDKTTLFGRTHLECQENSFLDGLLYAASYKNEKIQKLIHIYKYKFVKDLSKPLAKLMATFLKNVQKNIIPPSVLKTGLDPHHLTIIKTIPQFLLPDMTISYHPTDDPLKGDNKLREFRKAERANYASLPTRLAESRLEGDEHISRPRPQAGEQISTLRDSPNPNPTLIPIPLHSRRLRERGFNQAELLSFELSQLLNWPILTDVIKRRRYTTTQMSLKSEDRKQNIRDAFECKRPELINQKNIILIDDVFTTGSTIQEAARTLKQAGAREVWAFCLAKD